MDLWLEQCRTTTSPFLCSAAATKQPQPELSSSPAMVLGALVVEPLRAVRRLGCKALGWSFSDVTAGLRENRETMIQLSLNDYHFADEEWCQIFAALGDSTICRDLRLFNTDLTDEKMMHLAAALRENRSVVVLNVGKNPFGDEGARALATALQAGGRPRMEELRYHWTSMGQAGWQALAEVGVQQSRETGSRSANVFFGYVSQSPAASGQRFMLSNYKDAYEDFPDRPDDLRLAKSSCNTTALPFFRG